MLPSRSPAAPARPGDRSADHRRPGLCAMALAVGMGSAAGPWVPLRPIAPCANLFRFGRRSAAEVETAAPPTGLRGLAIPVTGALIVGPMARFGFGKICGHGTHPVVHPDAISCTMADLAVPSGIGRIPVASRRDGQVPGIVIRQDLLRARLDARRWEDRRSRSGPLRAAAPSPLQDGAAPN